MQKIINGLVISSQIQSRDAPNKDTIKFADSSLPSVYLTLRLLTDEVDPSGEKYYPKGVTNLKGALKNIKVKLEKPLSQDIEHSAYFLEVNNQTVLYNAGDIIELWTQEEDGLTALYGTARVGEEHLNYDENNNIIGSAYASAWLTHAQNAVNKAKNGSVKDYIPNEVYNKYFAKEQIIKPFKGLSVQIAHTHYKNENMIDGNGISHIFKSDLIRVAWILEEREGQPLSAILDTTIKTINNNNYINMNKTQDKIKCLCEAKLNDNVIKNNEIYEVIKSNNETHNYTIKNIVTEEETEVTTEEEAGEYEVVSDNTANAIKTCMSCMKKRELEKMAKKTEEETSTQGEANQGEETKTSNIDDEDINISILQEKLINMSEMLNSLMARVEALESMQSTIKTEEKPATPEVTTEEPETQGEETQGEDEIEISDSIKTISLKMNTGKTTNYNFNLLNN